MSEKNTILDRLNKRDAQRLEKIHQAHKAKEEADVSNETEEYFGGTFKTKSEYIADLLTEVPSLAPDSLHPHFDNIKKELAELQKCIVTATLFLKEFNMRKYLGIVQNLQTKCYELEEIYMPRKKFGFSRKKIPKPVEQKQPCKDESDSAAKRKFAGWDEKQFGFSSLQNQVLELGGDELFQRDVTLHHLKNCTVIMRGVLGTCHMTDLENCTVLCGPVTSSVFVERCTNLTLAVACQQLRMHTTTDCHVYLHVTSKGIIEDCSGIKTAPYNLEYDQIDEHFSLSSLDRGRNNWNCLDDFDWLAPDVPSPNWSVLDTDKRIQSWDEYWSKTPT